jgi:hypothetical protein
MKNASDLRKLAKMFPSMECVRLRKRQKRILRKIVGYCTEYAKSGLFEVTYWSHEYPEPNLSVEEAESIATTLNSMGYATNVLHDTESPYRDWVGIKISWK